jgi:hypothetical protein
MNGFTSLLRVAHLIGSGLGIGVATARTVLLIRCDPELSLVPVHRKVATPLTRRLMLGILLLTPSGLDTSPGI